MENFENKESQEREPEVILRVFLQRHGPKLSAVGEKNERAPNFDEVVAKGFSGLGISEGEGLVRVSSSNVERARKTALINQAKINETDHRSKQFIGTSENLAAEFLVENPGQKFVHDLKILIELQKKFKEIVKEENDLDLEQLDEEEREVVLRNIIDTQVLSVLFDKDKAKEAGLQTTYEDMADALAERYEGFLRHTSLLESKREKEQSQPEDEPYIQIDVSHSFPIMSFLKKYLVFEDGVAARDLSSAEFFERTGGVVGETKFLQMSYEKSNDGYLVKVEAEFVSGKKFSGEIMFNK